MSKYSECFRTEEISERVFLYKSNFSAILSFSTLCKKYLWVAMLICVQYDNESYSDVDAPTLDTLLLGKTIRQFYRPSEGRWVDVYRDPIRGLGGNYAGPERRQSKESHI